MGLIKLLLFNLYQKWLTIVIVVILLGSSSPRGNREDRGKSRRGDRELVQCRSPSMADTRRRQLRRAFESRHGCSGTQASAWDRGLERRHRGNVRQGHRAEQPEPELQHGFPFDGG